VSRSLPMAWINLASRRYVARAEAEFCFGPESTTTASMHVSGEIRAALLAGEPSRLEGHADAYRDLLRWKTEGGKTPDAGTLADTFAIVTGVAVLGRDVRPILRAIAGGKNYRDPCSRLLRSIAATVLEPSRRRPAPRPGRWRPSHGHVLKERSKGATWFEFASRVAADVALDLALCPDYEQFGYELGRTMLPLAMLVHAERRARGETSDLAELVRLGPYAERRAEVVFERTQAQPELFVSQRRHVAISRKPESWPSFDAVEIRGDELIAYHHLGLSFKAPLLFDRHLDAFAFLAEIERSWQLVEKQVAKRVWDRISRLRRSGRSKHVVVYDPAEAGPMAGHTAAAAEHYGVRLETASFLDL